jgi:amino acid adenylation domain-containing protein
MCCGEACLTYAALEQTTNRLAHLLLKEGVRPGDRVGLFLHKSIETVLGIFAILKTGAAYVPLDPLAPAQRVGFILQNCAIRCVLTKTAKLPTLHSALPDPWPLDLVLVMDEQTEQPSAVSSAPCTRSRHEADQESSAPPPSPAIDTDLAYILYTSGSTGNPKGVMLSHRHALTFIDWAAECFGVQSTDHFSNHAPFHFDLSIFDLFVSTKAGATLHIIPEGIAWFPADLVRFIATNQITVWYSVPSVLSLLVTHGQLQENQFPHLRVVCFAGEVFPVKYLRALMQLWSHAQFYNLYGPTETNVCTYYHVQELPEEAKSLSIGKACANTEVFALNEQLQRVKPGEVGELYVRGSLVMKGYWGRPEETARVIVEWKDASGISERIYRTGDLVIQEEDGNYTFLGRRDHMIKSRGYRIELGEVETALYSHAQVREAVVVAIPDERIGHRLRAVVVPAPEGELTATELLKHCARRLPKYMLPEAINFQDGLPKTSTGKIDRQRLLQELLTREATAT